MKRMRRLRRTAKIRNLVRETRISAEDFIYPVFVTEGVDIKNPVESMPGIFQWSVDRLDEIIGKVTDAGINAVMVFGIPDHKDEKGSEAYSDDGIAQRAVRRIKEICTDIIVIADVCLCEYTSHGHCGLVQDGIIMNDETLPLLARTAVSLAEAGSDMIAPSDMMDGRIDFIRKALDQNGFIDIPVMAYSAKFASAYYSPFRDAAHSAPAFGDRKTYQMDPANGKEALRECLTDEEEGADIVIVKPALAYLDVVKEAMKKCDVPVAVYNVSGEYSMVKAVAMNGWIDERRIVLENLTAMKRAGADMIITYHAIEAAGWIKDKR